MTDHGDEYWPLEEQFAFHVAPRPTRLEVIERQERFNVALRHFLAVESIEAIDQILAAHADKMALGMALPDSDAVLIAALREHRETLLHPDRCPDCDGYWRGAVEGPFRVCASCGARG